MELPLDDLDASHPGQSRRMFQLMLLGDPPRLMADGSWQYALEALGRTPRIFSERLETLSACTRTSVPRRRERLKDVRVVCLLGFRMEALSNHVESFQQ